jgi:serine/threonine protein kinase
LAFNFIGITISGYKLVEEIGVGEGTIGKVYRAEREGDIYNVRAIKLVKIDNIRDGWANEITKVNRLDRISGVVQYYDHGQSQFNGEEYLWIMWQYIPGKSLKYLIHNREVNIPIVKAILFKTLEVLHACIEVDINHGDLHTGNIIVENPDNRRIEQTHPVWITDFGYKASLGSGTLNDFDGLNRIIQDCLYVIDFHSLEGDDKQAYTVLRKEFPRYLLETNHTEGDFVKNPERLISTFKKLCEDKKALISSAQSNIQDYLAAELIGDQYDEWKKLFVPHFLGMDQLLGRNACVLTGLRGCGKTMIFRRLTALFNLHLGPTGIANSDTFIGFYLNARNIAEAFPWLPRNHKEEARAQVIHYFHISWTIEVIKWLKEYQKINKDISISWILDLLVKYFPNMVAPTSDSTLIVDYLLSYLSSELDNSRLKSGFEKKEWVLSDYQYLEKFFSVLSNAIPRVAKDVYYLFLDDYSTPLVKDVIQEILNPIVFRRSSIIIFKVSTESVESFVPLGLNDKSLEEGDDYVLIDFGNESIQRTRKERKEILSAILKPRIDRHSAFAPLNCQLQNIIGDSEYNNDQLAMLIKGEDKSRVQYFGYDMFCSVWSSNVREMISLFADMVSLTDIRSSKAVKTAIDSKTRVVSETIQDKVLRTAGGNFLQLLSSATPDTTNADEKTDYQLSFGDHLVKIAKSFQEIALFEIQHKESKNVTKKPPKHARRIEIKEIKEFEKESIREYYKGIIRYGVFLRDNRGKSVRGRAVPRLVLRGLLIPYFTLTFSLRGNVMLSWEDFCHFLEAPEEFSKIYIERQEKSLDKSKTENNQGKLRFEE